MAEVDLELEFEPADPVVAVAPEPELEIEPDPEPEPEASQAVSSTALVSTALVEILPADFELPLLTKFIPNPAIRTAVAEASRDALAIVVSGPEGLQQADDALARLRARIKAVDEHFEDPTRIANDLHKRLTGLRGEWKRDGLAAIETVGRRMFDESERLKAIERERLRHEQEEANRLAREEAARQAQEAEAQQAPPEVVEELKTAAKTATAPPVSRPASGGGLRSNTTTKTWKARIVGTPADAEDMNPSVTDLTPAQRLKVIELLKAIVEGKAPLAAIEVSWSYLNKRAAADKSAMGIPGIEAFQVGGVRAKGGR